MEAPLLLMVLPAATCSAVATRRNTAVAPTDSIRINMVHRTILARHPPHLPALRQHRQHQAHCPHLPAGRQHRAHCPHLVLPRVPLQAQDGFSLDVILIASKPEHWATGSLLSAELQT
jgi:hypothetical protein